MSSLASLVVDLSVNTAALRRGLDDATGSLKKFEKDLGGIKSSIEAMGALKAFDLVAQGVKAAADAIASMATGGSEYAAKTQNLAAAAGASAEQFTKLAYAARLAGVSDDELGSAFNKLNKTLGAAAAGGKDQVALFKALGVSVTDASGHVKSGSDAFLEMAHLFGGLEDGASKSALEMLVFGRAGAELDHLLGEVSNGLGAAGDEADRLGITLSGDTLTAARLLGDQGQRLDSVYQALSVRLAADLGPALKRLVDDLLSNKSTVKTLQDAVDQLAAALKSLVSAAVIAAAALDILKSHLPAIAGSLASLIPGVGGLISAFSGIADAATANSEDTTQTLGAMFKRLNEIWNEGTLKFQMAGTEQENISKKSADAILKNYGQLKELPSAVEGMKSLTKVLDDYNKKIAEIAGGGSKDPIAEITERLDKGDLKKDLAAVGDQAGVMRQKILDAASALQKLQIGNLKVQLNFEAGLSSDSRAFGAQQRTQGYDNIGKGQGQIWAQATEGFNSFRDALAANQIALDEQTKELNIAKEATAAGGAANLVIAQQAQVAAQAQGFLAEKADQAAKAFEEMKSAGSQWVGGLKVLGAAFTAKLGQLGTTINDAIQGFQQGGIWGALAALVMDLLSMMDGWKKIQNLAQGQLMMALQDMSKGLNDVIGALEPLMGAIEAIAQAVHGVLGPILSLIGKVLADIAPLFQTIGYSLQALLSPIGVLLQIVGGILDPLLKLMGITLEPLVLVFMALKVGVDYVALAFNYLVEWVDSWVGQNNAGGIADASNNLVNDTAALKQFADDMLKDPLNAQQDLADQTAKTAEAMGATANATNAAAAATSKFTSALTNLPDGFKYNAARFNAMQPGANSGWSPTSTGSGSSGVAPGALGAGKNTGSNVTVYVQGSVVTEKDLVKTIKEAIGRDHFQVFAHPSFFFNQK